MAVALFHSHKIFDLDDFSFPHFKQRFYNLNNFLDTGTNNNQKGGRRPIFE